MRLLTVQEMNEIVGAGLSSSGTYDTGTQVVDVNGTRPDPDLVVIGDGETPDLGDPWDPFLPTNGGGGGATGNKPIPLCHPNSQNTPKENIKNRVNKEFIKNHEGGLRTTGNWPEGNSGITIGAGVDLRFVSLNDLKALGLSQKTIDALKDYLGLFGAQAASFAKQNGFPTISEADAITLTNFKFEQTLTLFLYYWNKDTSTDFFSLPANVQTALADLAYQTPNASKWSNALSYAQNGDWDKLVAELQDWNHGKNDPDIRRHNDLGNLIKASIESGDIAKNSTSCRK